MTKPKRKPYDPAAAERIRAMRESEREMAEHLEAQPSTAVNRDPQTGKLTGAWRLNCFNVLLEPKSPERHAIDWLDDLIRTASGENTQERRPDFIRSSTEGAPGQNVSQSMIEASRTLCCVETAMHPTHMRMLFDLMKPDASLLTRWRDVVAQATGETNHAAQGAVVRSACTMLVWIQSNIGRLVEEAKAKRRMAA